MIAHAFYMVIGSSNKVRSTHLTVGAAYRAAFKAEDRVRVIRGPRKGQGTVIGEDADWADYAVIGDCLR